MIFVLLSYVIAYARIGSSYEKMGDIDRAIDALNKSLVEDYADKTKTQLKNLEALKKKRAEEAYIEYDIHSTSLFHYSTSTSFQHDTHVFYVVIVYFVLSACIYIVLSNLKSINKKVMNYLMKVNLLKLYLNIQKQLNVILKIIKYILIELLVILR